MTRQLCQGDGSGRRICVVDSLGGWAAALVILAGLLHSTSWAGGEECQNQIKIDICKAGCSATEDICGGLCDAGNGVCWVACEAAYGTCDLGCDACDLGCDICCATGTCNCGNCRGECDDCHGDCTNVRNGCHNDCQLDCDGCILNCERDCESICRPFRQVGEFCTPLVDRCADGLICWPIPFPGELRQRCFPSENDELIDDDTCRSFYSRALHEGAMDIGGAMSYGTGGSAAIGGALSQEVGVVYSPDSRFGCYTTYCFGLVTDVSTSIYAGVGLYIDYDSFRGESVVFVKTAGKGINFSTSQIFNTGFDLIGTADSLSLGIGILPFDVGAFNCVTIVDTVGEYNETTGTLDPVTNSPPLALCANRTVCADSESCLGSADVNNESRDPDFDDLSFDYHGPTDYPLGITNVTLTVRDPSGAGDECQATVTVEDCAPPALTCPPSIDVDCEADSAAFVHPGAAEVFDCTKTVVTEYAGASFPIGETTLTYTATDAAGLQSSCVQSITVQAPDSDADGVPDCNDLCPSITAFSSTGCGAPLVAPAPSSDFDGDGVEDDSDDCPNTTEGAQVDASGCAAAQLDTDNDSVTDDIDECPDTPAGTQVGADGCLFVVSPVDNDGDGVANDEDNCLDAANADQADGDNDGVGDACDDSLDEDEPGLDLPEEDGQEQPRRNVCGAAGFITVWPIFLGLMLLRSWRC